MVEPPYPQPRLREPMFNVPAVVLGLIVAFVVVQVLRGLLVDDDGEALLVMLSRYAFVPLRFMAFSLGIDQEEAAARLASLPPDEQALATVFLGEALREGLAPWTLVTHAFLHGGWTHLLLNAAWLLAFGTPLARRFGGPRFLAYFLGVAALAAVLAALLRPLEPWPVVGASGAIAGLMAGAMRFIFPAGQQGLQGGFSHRGRALSLREAMRHRQVLVFSGFFVAMNLLFALGLVPPGVGEGRVAWEVHLTGFTVGFLLFPLFDRWPMATLAGPRD
jgi:membrane associated rhomboid family serine protease